MSVILSQGHWHIPQSSKTCLWNLPDLPSLGIRGNLAVKRLEEIWCGASAFLTEAKKSKKPERKKSLSIQDIWHSRKAIFTSRTFRVLLSPPTRRNEGVVEHWVGEEINTANNLKWRKYLRFKHIFFIFCPTPWGTRRKNLGDRVYVHKLQILP